MDLPEQELQSTEDTQTNNDELFSNFSTTELNTNFQKFYKQKTEHSIEETTESINDQVSTNEGNDNEEQESDTDDINEHSASFMEDLGSPSPSIPGTPERSLLSIDHRFTTRFNSITSFGSPGSTLHRGLAPNFDNLFNEFAPTTDPLRWSKLQKLSTLIFSENSISTYGTPTSILPGAHLAIGTTEGYVLIFDYQQNLHAILGNRTLGEVTALATSADFSNIAVGHSSGHIFIYSLSGSVQLHVHPISLNFVGKPPKDGHLEKSRIIHLNFLGKRHTALISGDDRGMSFVHSASRGMLGRKQIKTRRIMGRYPQPHLTLPQSRNIRPTALLGCAPLPLGTGVQGLDSMGIVAIMTTSVLAIVSVIGGMRTEFKTGRPKKNIRNEDNYGEREIISGCLSWYPAMKGYMARLAYCWDQTVTVVEISAVVKNDERVLEVSRSKRFISDEAIVSIQWIGPKVS